MKKPFFASTQKIFSKLPLKQEDFEVPSVNQKDLEHKCRMLVQYMDQPVIVTDKNERTIYANPRLCQLLECTLSEILGKKSYDFCTKDTSKMVRYVTSTDRKSGVISSYEVSLLSKTKKKIPVRVHGIPLDDGGTVGIFYDLRQLKEKEQQAEMQKMYFEQLFANDSEGIIVLDDQDHILNINPAFTDLFGFALKEIRGKILNDTIVPNHLKNEGAYLTSSMAAGNRIDYESVRQHKNGTLIPVSIVGAPIIISGKKAGIYVIYRNITKRRKSEEALRQSEKEYRSIFENTGTATIIIEETTVISLANSEFEKLSGYTKAEIEEKKRWTDFFVGEDAKKMMHYHKMRRVDPDAAPRNYESCFINKNGEKRNVYLTVGMIPGTKRSVTSFLDVTSHKKAENALHSSEEKYRCMIDQSVVGIGIFDKTKLFFSNQKLATIFGYNKPEEVIGLDVKDILTPESYCHAKKTALARMMGKSIPEKEECVGIKKNGEHIHIQIHAERLVIGDKKYVHVFVTDNTEKKKAERDLKERMNELRVLYNVSSHTLIRIPLKQVLQNITRDILPTLRFTELAYAEIELDDQRYHSASKTKTFAYKMREPIIIDNKKRGFIDLGYFKRLSEMNEQPFLNEDRLLLKDVANTLSQHIRSREIYGRFDKLLNKINMGIFILESNVFRYVNPHFCNLFKLKEDQIIGKKYHDLVMGCPLLVFKKTTCRCLVNGTRTHCMPKGKCGNGNLIDLEIIVQKIDYHGKEGILGVLQDITEIRHTEDKIQRFNEELKMAITEKTFDLEEANKRLRSLNELKDEFIAVTSHELRSPLTTIRGYLSFLTDEEHLKTMPEQDQQYLIRAYNNVDVLNNLVNNILDVSRLESGRFQLKKTSVNLVTLIKNIIDNLAIHLRSGKLRIIFNNKTQQKQFTIHVDNVRIHQVLMNVLENAIKYSKSNKDIVVDLEKDGKKALIRITNHGVGIPRSQIKYIFDKFIQGKNATTRYKGGAGLGLFIVKRIVELHGGKISVQSHPKKGTVFTIQFPIS